MIKRKNIEIRSFFRYNYAQIIILLDSNRVVFLMTGKKPVLSDLIFQ